MPMIFPNYGINPQPSPYPPPQRGVGVNIGRDHEGDMFMMAMIQAMLGNQQAQAQLAERKYEFGQEHELLKQQAEEAVNTSRYQRESAQRMEELQLDALTRSQVESERQAILSSHGTSFAKENADWIPKKMAEYTTGLKSVAKTTDSIEKVIKSVKANETGANDRAISILQDLPNKLKALDESKMGEFEKSGAVHAMHDAASRLAAAAGGDKNVLHWFDAYQADAAPIIDTYNMDRAGVGAIITQQAARRQAVNEMNLSGLRNDLLMASADLLGKGVKGEALSRELPKVTSEIASRYKSSVPDEFSLTRSDRVSSPIEGEKELPGMVSEVGQNISNLPSTVMDPLFGRGASSNPAANPMNALQMLGGVLGNSFRSLGMAPRAVPEDSHTFQFNGSDPAQPVRLDVPKVTEPGMLSDEEMMQMMFPNG